MRKLLAVLGAAAILLTACSHKTKTPALPGLPALSPLDTSTTSPFAFAFGTTTTVAGTTTSTPAATTTVPAKTTTVPGTTTTHPVATTTTVASGPLRVCAPTDLGITLATDHPGYPAGQPVNISTSIKDTSRSACDIGRDPKLTIYDPSGKTVASQLVTVFTGAVNAGQIRPGQTRIVTLTWYQNTCGGTRCPTGTGYSALIDLGDIAVPAVRFALT